MHEAKELGAPVRAGALGRARGPACRCRTSPPAASRRRPTRALCMQLGAESVFVGSGIFKSDDPAARASHRARGHPLQRSQGAARGLGRARRADARPRRRPARRRRSCCRPAAGSWRSRVIGILALSGRLRRARGSARPAWVRRPRLVRTPADLAAVAGLVLPGGESTTMLRLLERDGLEDRVRDFTAAPPHLRHLRRVILLARG